MTPGAWISFGIAFIFSGGAILMVFETIRLARDEQPITFYTRAMVKAYPRRAFLLAFALAFGAGLLLGHFF